MTGNRTYSLVLRTAEREEGKLPGFWLGKLNWCLLLRPEDKDGHSKSDTILRLISEISKKGCLIYN